MSVVMFSEMGCWIFGMTEIDEIPLWFLFRARATTRCLGGSSLWGCHIRVVHSSEFVLVRRQFAFEACVENEVEVSVESPRQLGFWMFSYYIEL